MPVYSQVNEKLLNVRLAGEEVFAKAGAMIAYRGEVAFARSFLAGQGVQSLAMRAATREGYQLMSAKGTGEVLYGQHGLFVTLIALRAETLHVESERLLAFDARLRAGVMFLGNQGGMQGIMRGAVSGQGLFTSTLEGTGEAAILSDGQTIALQVAPEQPMAVDPDAYIAHTGRLSSTVITDLNWKTFIGQASGESYQVKFTGQGVVYIQASER
jgi:uncharacterized protein (AIM24 family)